jgi:hypothetical protein
MVQLQDSILECLHDHTLSNMFFDETFKAHCAQILSCFGPRASVWLTSRLIFLTNLLNTPPNSLKDSIVGPKVKTTKKELVYPP